MKSASYVPDGQIKTSPTLDDKSVIRYGVDGPGWIVSPSDDPKVTLTLTDPVTGEAPYVKKIIILPHVNVEKVKLTMTKELDNGNRDPDRRYCDDGCSWRNRLFSSCETGIGKAENKNVPRFLRQHRSQDRHFRLFCRTWLVDKVLNMEGL